MGEYNPMQIRPWSTADNVAHWGSTSVVFWDPQILVISARKLSYYFERVPKFESYLFIFIYILYIIYYILYIILYYIILYYIILYYIILYIYIIYIHVCMKNAVNTHVYIYICIDPMTSWHFLNFKWSEAPTPTHQDMCAWWHIRTAARELTNEPWIKFYRRTTILWGYDGDLPSNISKFCLDFQTNSYHSHGKSMAGLTLSLSLSSYWRWQVLLGSLGYIFHFTGLCTGVYQTPNTVCRWRFNMSAIWFISGIFMCANTSTCMHTRKEWRF